MPDDAIYVTVDEVIRRRIGGDISIGPSTPLSALAADSLTLVEILFELEEQFDVELPFNANEVAKHDSDLTVSSLVDVARRALAGGQA